MAIDRDAALKQAEKLLRQGKLDGAIGEYVRLIEDQPRDWNSINALGDLYVRAGDVDRAVTQFTRVADYLFGEGFFPKAAALYKKALKIKSDHEPTLLRLSEIAALQGLLADAKQYLRQLGRQRRDRGDERGADECLVRLGTFEESDAESKIAGARAALALGHTVQATALFKEAADVFDKGGRKLDALEALAEAAPLVPDDVELRGRLARDCVAAGLLERARLFLTRESAGDDPDLLLALGRIELAAGNDQEARAVLTHLISVAPDRAAAILRVADEMVQTGRTDTAFGCTEVVVDAALRESDWNRAVAALQAFLPHAPYIPALMKLVEVAVDTGRDDLMYDAQAQLADAYLTAGRAAEARVIAEDLVARDRGSDVHAHRLRRALVLLGVSDPEEIVRQHREPESRVDDVIDLAMSSMEPSAEAVEPFDRAPDRPSPEPEPTPEPRPLAVPPRSAFVPAPADPVPPTDLPWPGPPRSGDMYVGEASQVDDGAITIDVRDLDPGDEPVVFETSEVDLSEALAKLGAVTTPSFRPQGIAPPGSVVPTDAAAPPQDLEAVFEEMRTRLARGHQATDAAAQYERGLQHLEQGRIADACVDLEAAARAPMFRFSAAARLGRLHVARGELAAGVDWLERAAEAPAPWPDEGLAVLYDLAATLEQMGETARTLAILMEINADTDGYRDVRERIVQLTRVQTGSHGT